MSAFGAAHDQRTEFADYRLPTAFDEQHEPEA
jgi:hypothetical protein